MWTVLLTNWKTVLGVVVTCILAYGLHALDVYRIEDQQRAALAAQADALVKQCDAEKKITKEVSDGYQKQLDAVATELARVKRVRPATCVVVSASTPTHGRNETPVPNKLARQDGVTSDALYDFASEAEGYRLQLIACQDFVNKTWTFNQQSGENK